MLSDQDKKEMLEDANNPLRAQAFAQARQRTMQPMTWKSYLHFLTSIQNLFPQQRVPHKIQGNTFKL